MRIAATLGISLLLVAVGTAHADYIAVSNTAMAITGDVQMDDFEIVFENGETLQFDELVGDTFIVDGETVNASVYSIAEPADPVLLNGNRLCGNGEVTYLANWTGYGDTDVIAVFTTQDVPASDADMCVSYTYEYAN